MKRIIYNSLLFLIMLTMPYMFVKANDAEGSGHDVGFSIGPNFALTDLGGAKKIGAPFKKPVKYYFYKNIISRQWQ